MSSGSPSVTFVQTADMEQQELNFQRIATAIDYVRNNFKRQPSLEEIAEVVHLSPFHFQRMFTEWAGVSPKKFLQYTSIEYAKHLLKDRQATLFDAAEATGLSGTGRLHDLFVTIEAMTPGEFKNGGESLKISYEFAATPFGIVCVASTDKGICHLEFTETETEGLSALTKRFPGAELQPGTAIDHPAAIAFFQRDWNNAEKIRLHLKGTEFQLKVWQALLQIPSGALSSYGKLAETFGNPGASRAIGTAIGDNPVAFIIPCHRVIQSGGQPGGYHWGIPRKNAMIAWEAVLLEEKEG